MRQQLFSSRVRHIRRPIFSNNCTENSCQAAEYEKSPSIVYSTIFAKPQKGTLFHHGFKRNKTAQIHTPNLSKISNLECKNIHFFKCPCRVLSTKTEEITSDTDPFSAFWTYTLITAMTPGPNNILPLALLRRMDFVKVPVCWQGWSGIFDCDVTVCGHFIFTGSVDPAAVHLLSWAGAAYIIWLRGKSPPAQQRKTDFRQNQSVLDQLCFAVCERQNHFVRCYALSTFVLPQTQALSWVVGVSFCWR